MRCASVAQEPCMLARKPLAIHHTKYFQGASAPCHSSTIVDILDESFDMLREVEVSKQLRQRETVSNYQPYYSCKLRLGSLQQHMVL